MIVPEFSSYGEYASGNYGAHAMRFRLPNGVSFYYSYNTLVAFGSPLTGKVVRYNEWSTTTGKHLNWIDGGGVAKKVRLQPDKFEEALKEMMEQYGLNTAPKEQCDLHNRCSGECEE